MSKKITGILMSAVLTVMLLTGSVMTVFAQLETGDGMSADQVSEAAAEDVSGENAETSTDDISEASDIATEAADEAADETTVPAVENTSSEAAAPAAEATEETAAATTDDISAETSADSDSDFDGLVIVYTNDIHSHFANEKNVDPNDKNSEKVPALRLSTVSQLVKDLKAAGNDVLLVDAGDEVQGDIYGSIDEGESVINLMNAVGYDIATIGNHEFDYGMDRMFQLTSMADYPYVTCNFHCTAADAQRDPFDSYKIFEVDGKKIAFIGITTPESITASTPVYFQDENGQFIYDFDGASDPQDLYDAVQETIDQVRDEVDYVIALGHTGVAANSQAKGISSYEIIANTSGIDAYIDGHSHTTMEREDVLDKDGNSVLLTQTGCYLAAIGKMTISADGQIDTELITDYDGQDPDIAAMEEVLYQKVNDELGEEIAVVGSKLYTNNPELDSQRLIRAQELNLGDFVSDAVYWYLNEDRGLDCDIVLANGGGIRDQIDAGAATYLDVKKVNPFGNMICLIYATGQQILDALEMGVTVTGEYDEEWQAPAENGGFLQVAGMKYSIDASIPSSVVTDDQGMFVSVDGSYRVNDVEVYNRQTGEYEPLDLTKVYTVGGVNYILRNGGNGLSMFMKNDMVVDYIGEDWQVLASYMKSFAVDGELPLVVTQNSPLTAYAGYQLDYDNPYGAGRITITGADN